MSSRQKNSSAQKDSYSRDARNDKNQKDVSKKIAGANFAFDKKTITTANQIEKSIAVRNPEQHSNEGTGSNKVVLVDVGYGGSVDLSEPDNFNVATGSQNKETVFNQTQDIIESTPCDVLNMQISSQNETQVSQNAVDDLNNESALTNASFVSGGKDANFDLTGLDDSFGLDKDNNSPDTNLAQSSQQSSQTSLMIEPQSRSILGKIVASKTVVDTGNFILIAKDDDTFLIKISNPHIFALLRPGRCVSLSDCTFVGISGIYRTNDNSLLRKITDNVKYDESKDLNIDKFIDMYMFPPPKTIENIKNTMKPDQYVPTLDCVIIEIYPTYKCRSGENLQFRHIDVADESGKITIRLWRDFADHPFLLQGTKINLTNLKVYEDKYQNELQLKLKTTVRSLITEAKRDIKPLPQYFESYNKTYYVKQIYLHTMKEDPACPKTTCKLKTIRPINEHGINRCIKCMQPYQFQELLWSGQIRIVVNTVEEENLESPNTECSIYTNSLYLLADCKPFMWSAKGDKIVNMLDTFYDHHFVVKGNLDLTQGRRSLNIVCVLNKIPL